MTTLIGRRCTHSNVFSRPVLIGRGLGFHVNWRVRACYRTLNEHRFPVAIAAGSHPFPFRTRKLSLPAPMVLGDRSPWRVGRRRNNSQKTPRKRGVFVVLDLGLDPWPRIDAR